MWWERLWAGATVDGGDCRREEDTGECCALSIAGVFEF